MNTRQNKNRGQFEFDSKIPRSLLDLEKWTAEMIIKPLKKTGSLNLPAYETELKNEIEKKISPGAHLTAAECIGIYNQQYWFRFFTLAQENYPALLRLFGYEDFNQMIAEPAILKYPANHWAVFLAAAQIPRWIEEEYKGEDKILVLQIAQLDALYHNSLYAPAEPKIGRAPLGFVNLQSHQNDPNLNDCSPAISKQHSSPHDCLNLSHFENPSNAQNLTARGIDPADRLDTKFDRELVKFRNELLKESVEYWAEHPFPEINFSKTQPKEGEYLSF